MRKLVLLGAVAVAAIASAAIAQPSGRERITLYDGPNFTGRSVTYDHDISNLPREFQDRAVSVRIVGSWRVCSDSDYRGQCVEIDRDIRDLRALGMDRTISSMKNTGPYGGGGRPGGGYDRPGGGYDRPGGYPGGGYPGDGRPTGRERITLYEGPNYTGRSYSFDRDITNLPAQYQDRALSVRIVGSWRLCDFSDFRGQCVEISRDVPDLRALGMDRRVSSMKNTGPYGGGYGDGRPGGGWDDRPGGGYDRPGDDGWRRARITIYNGPGFSGASRTFDGDFTNLPREFNDTAYSVRVEGRWEVCVDSSYRGRCTVIDRDIRDLRSIGMERTISSLRERR